MTGPFSSFRLRMALLSGSITAVFVVVTCLVLWDLTYRFNLDTVDAAIDRIGRSSLESVSGQAYWRRLDESLSVFGGESDSHRYVIYVSNNERHVFHSDAWPLGIDDQRGLAVDSIYVDTSDLPEQPRRGEPVSEANPALPVLGVVFDTVVDTDGKRWRLGVLKNHYQSLAIALDLAGFEEGMANLRNRFYWVSPFALLGMFGLAWWFAHRSLRPVSRLADAVESVNASGLDYRVDVERYSPEYKRLALMFNEMLERLEKSFLQASRFSSDASHELKTPLARLQMELEAALDDAPAESKEQAVYSNLLDEIGRLKDISHKLLLLSLSDAGCLPLDKEEADLGSMLRGVLEDWELMEPERLIRATIVDEVLVFADRLLFEQAIQNIVSNAVKYGYERSEIGVELRTENGSAFLIVSNEGEPIPESERSRVFDRFFRSDEARNVRGGGAGLGLSLSREIVRAHGGDIWVDRSDGQLTVFVLKIPLAS